MAFFIIRGCMANLENAINKLKKDIEVKKKLTKERNIKNSFLGHLLARMGLRLEIMQDMYKNGVTEHNQNDVDDQLEQKIEAIKALGARDVNTKFPQDKVRIFHAKDEILKENALPYSEIDETVKLMKLI